MEGVSSFRALYQSDVKLGFKDTFRTTRLISSQLQHTPSVSYFLKNNILYTFYPFIATFDVMENESD